jgi:hypothetical protein
MSREKCEQHQVTDCLMCQMAARKKNPPAPPNKVEGVPDYAIGMEQEVTSEDLAQIVGTIPGSEKLDNCFTHQPSNLPPGKYSEVISFDVLPVDDSAASQTVRAAAAFSKASMEYAKAVVAVASLKTQLLMEEAKLSKAFKTRQDAEAEMKRLTGDVS